MAIVAEIARKHQPKDIRDVVAPTLQIEDGLSSSGAAQKPLQLIESLYTQWVQDYPSLEDAKPKLGVGVRCQGHCARAVKKMRDRGVYFLKCNLSKSQPSCTWAALLKTRRDGTVGRFQHPEHCRMHNSDSKLVGVRGFQDLSERQELQKLLMDRPTSKPRLALRSARLKKTVTKANKKDVKLLKRQLLRKYFNSTVLGDLHRAVQPFEAAPLDPTKPYFCYHEVGRDRRDRPKLSVVATTQTLQQRWATGSSEDCFAHCDGGFKFNICGWCVHLLGQTNPAGEWSLGALMCTSSNEKPHIRECFGGFVKSTTAITGRSAKRKHSMSDGEDAYRSAFKYEFGVEQTGMCFFHVKSGGRKWIFKHARGNGQDKQQLWDRVAGDLDIIRFFIFVESPALDPLLCTPPALHHRM